MENDIIDTQEIPVINNPDEREYEEINEEEE